MVSLALPRQQLESSKSRMDTYTYHGQAAWVSHVTLAEDVELIDSTPCNFSSAHAEPTPSAESSAGRNAGLTHGQLLFLTILCVLLGVWIP